MYASILRIHGHQVRVEADGTAGLLAAAEADFDVVLLDIRMPHMDGMDVLAQLMGGERTRTWPIVMLTNYDDPELRERARDLGARDYLVKSQLMPAQLVAKVSVWAATSGQ
jgi:CheY-like chemotaxis protein